MGQLRDNGFDAVIGVGGIGEEARRFDISRKITWVGLNPNRIGSSDLDGHPVLAFEKSRVYEAQGPSFVDAAPKLAKRIYERNIRQTLISEANGREYLEVRNILLDLLDSSPSDLQQRSLVKPASRRSPERSRRRCEASYCRQEPVLGRECPYCKRNW